MGVGGANTTTSLYCAKYSKVGPASANRSSSSANSSGSTLDHLLFMSLEGGEGAGCEVFECLYDTRIVCTGFGIGQTGA